MENQFHLRDELGLKQKRIPRRREKEHVRGLGDMEKHSVSEGWRNVWHGGGEDRAMREEVKRGKTDVSASMHRDLLLKGLLWGRGGAPAQTALVELVGYLGRDGQVALRAQEIDLFGDKDLGLSVI